MMVLLDRTLHMLDEKLTINTSQNEVSCDLTLPFCLTATTETIDFLAGAVCFCASEPWQHED